MPWFEGTHTETRALSVPPDAARAHFADRAMIVAQTPSAESATVDGETIHFVMKPEDHGVVKFQGRFSCRYWLDDGVLRWETAEGSNMTQRGEARFEPAGAGTELRYIETVALDLDVPSMMAPMLRPVISAMVASEIKDFVKRMAAAL
jgi:carbon monoxide dehydrogenase subunit G